MTDHDRDQGPEDVTGERTSAFRADFTNGHDAAATAGAEGRLLGAEALPQGSALLVVKRGPNAGSRFCLDQPTTTAGRHPNSDIFLDDITVSRRHAQFRCPQGVEKPPQRLGGTSSKLVMNTAFRYKTTRAAGLLTPELIIRR
jgi:pSer/pThr/pTyr-binding forkhead associated (FHA) protein